MCLPCCWPIDGKARIQFWCSGTMAGVMLDYRAASWCRPFASYWVLPTKEQGQTAAPESFSNPLRPEGFFSFPKKWQSQHAVRYSMDSGTTVTVGGSNNDHLCDTTCSNTRRAYVWRICANKIPFSSPTSTGHEAGRHHAIQSWCVVWSVDLLYNKQNPYPNRYLPRHRCKDTIAISDLASLLSKFANTNPGKKKKQKKSRNPKTKNRPHKIQKLIKAKAKENKWRKKRKHEDLSFVLVVVGLVSHPL